MKGDFSRNTFYPRKNYHAVRMQQGRVLLDADWNEMVDIVNDQHTTAMRTVIGTHGGLGTGFKVTFADKATTLAETYAAGEEATLPLLHLHSGLYYANGFSCSLAETISFEQQPHFPGAAMLKKAAATHAHSGGWLVYLDVWERHLTAIEDPDLVEPALGGADTTSRTQMVWQVKLLRVNDHMVHPHTVELLPEWQRLLRTQNQSLQMNQGYAAENELFRIEIHSGNAEDESGSEGNQAGTKPATWKWSRDNASIAFPLQGIRRVENSEGMKCHTLELSLGADQRLQEQVRKGDCVELDCDEWALDGRPGRLGCVSQVEAPDENGRQRVVISVSQPVNSDRELVSLQTKNNHPLVRCWDQLASLDKNEVGGFTVFQVDAANLLSRSALEILIPENQAELYRGDWVDLSGISEGQTWQVGQVREITAENGLQKIRVNLVDPVPAGVTIEKLSGAVQMRRWKDEALPVIPNVDQALEHGITVRFPPGKYRAGEYWLTPIRGGVDPNRAFTAPPAAAAHAFAPLAFLKLHDSQWEITDLRRIFQDLGDVFARLELLEAALRKTQRDLADLHSETDLEDEEQEVEIVTLKKEVTEVYTEVEELPVLTIQQYAKRYRSPEVLKPGDVVAESPYVVDAVIKANFRAAPIGVVAPRPDEFAKDEYRVVLSGPIQCRIQGRVKAGDLLETAREPGCLQKASFWTRWLFSERIIARAIDNPTSPGDRLINVLFMPDYVKKED